MKKPIDLSINTDKVHVQLVDFIRQETQRAGYERAVVGVSGGVDSALSFYLVVEALGEENVLAVRMPYKTSSPDSLAHADLIIEEKGVKSVTIPITPMVEPLFEQFPEANPTRRGNAMARVRMIVIFDQSVAFRGLVVGTGNKTEVLLGYTTLYGDAACAFNPLGDLYKTQVRQLARALGVPEVIITKPPSADLWEGQTDEGELGFTYAEVDQLLYLLVEEQYSPQACVDAGFEKEFVEQVIDRIRRNRFKRNPPTIAKVSKRTLGQDFTFAGDWEK
jgi:NAD+ synthase